LVKDGLEKDIFKIAHHNLSIQRPNTEHGNRQQESSDISSLTGIDSISDKSKANIFENRDILYTLIYKSTNLSKYHSEGILDNFEDLLNAEALLLFIHNLLDASSKENQEYTL